MSQSSLERETVFQRVSDGLSRWSLRWVPDAWVIVVLLTLLVFVLAYLLAPGDYTVGKAGDLVQGWGDGFWELLEFGMQMSLIILTGYVVATSPPFRRLLTWVADRPRGPRSAVAVMAATSMLLVLVNWGLGLVGSAVLVRYMAVRQPQVDYRLLVACAYLGMAGTWHAGLSASAPLLVATPGHFAEDYFGLISVSQTIFSGFNMVMTLLVLLLWVAMAPLLHPRSDKVVRPPDEVTESDESVDDDTLRSDGPGTPRARPRRTPAERIENSVWLNLAIGVGGLLYLGLYFRELNDVLAGITLDIVNFAFLFVGVLRPGTPTSSEDTRCPSWTVRERKLL